MYHSLWTFRSHGSQCHKFSLNSASGLHLIKNDQQKNSGILTLINKAKGKNVFKNPFPYENFLLGPIFKSLKCLLRLQKT